MHGMMEIVRIGKIENGSTVRLMVELFSTFNQILTFPFFYPLVELFPIYAIRTISVFPMQSRNANSNSN